MNRIILLCAGALLAFSSCEKKETPIDTSKNAYLQKDAWQMRSFISIANIAEPVEIDEYPDVTACKKDDFFTFTSNFDGKYNDYFIRCNTALPEFTNILYTVTGDDTYLKVYTDPADVNGSVLIQGIMKTPTIDSFSLTYNTFDSASGITSSKIYGYKRFQPTF